VPYKDPLTADTVLVRGAIQSPNYVPGVSGWIVRQNGTAEFSDLTARGTIVANQIKTSDLQNVPRIWVNNPAGDPNVIRFYRDNQNDATVETQLARIYSTPFGGTASQIILRAVGDDADTDKTDIQISAGAAGTGVGAVIQLTSPDAIDFFSNPGFFRINGQRVQDRTGQYGFDISANANQAVTNAFVDIAGMSQTFTPTWDCDVCISATFDELVSVGIGAGGLAIHRLMVDGVAQARTPYVRADTPLRDMTSGAWEVSLTGGASHTIKFQVQKSINAGTVQLQSSVTGAALTVLENGNP